MLDWSKTSNCWVLRWFKKSLGKSMKADWIHKLWFRKACRCDVHRNYHYGAILLALMLLFLAAGEAGCSAGPGPNMKFFLWVDLVSFRFIKMTSFFVLSWLYGTFETYQKVSKPFVCGLCLALLGLRGGHWFLCSTHPAAVSRSEVLKIICLVWKPAWIHSKMVPQNEGKWRGERPVNFKEENYLEML